MNSPLPDVVLLHLQRCPWLYAEQKRAAEKLLRERGGVAWWKVGQGKTRIALAWFIIDQLLTGKNPTDGLSIDNPFKLTVVCRTAGFYDWQTEADFAGIGHRITLVSEGMLGRDEVLVSQICAGTISPGSLALHCVFDEGFLYKNPKSKRAQAAHRISRSVQTVMLSGSIMTAQKLDDIYGQAFAIYKHKRISPNHTQFMSEFMMTFNDKGYPQTYPKRGAYKTIIQRCEPFADIHFPKNNQRTITERIRKCAATPEQLLAFAELRQTASYQAADLQLSSMAAVLVKTMQISGGWVKDSDGLLHAIPSNKPPLLWESLDRLVSAGERVIVYCAFRHEVTMLSAQCPHINVVMLGGQKFDLDGWFNSSTKVCFASEASASTVNHFAQVAHAIYYSMDWKWQSLQQSMGRTDRRSSMHPECFYDFFQVEGSVDDAVYRQVRQSQSREGAMIKMMQEFQAWLGKKEGMRTRNLQRKISTLVLPKRKGPQPLSMADGYHGDDD